MKHVSFQFNRMRMRTTTAIFTLLCTLTLSTSICADDQINNDHQALTPEIATPPFKYVWGHAYHILPETHNSESGYFSLCEGLDGKIYVGTAKYGENSYLVEFNPKTGQQKIVIDTNKVCGLQPKSYNEAQSKIHTRNSVGRSGTIYVGSMESPKPEDPTQYPGGYVMTYDPTTETAKSHGIASPGMGVIDVVSDEERGIVYVVLINAKKPWMLYDLKTKQYRPLGPIPTVFGTTLIDNRGHANVITKDFQLAQFNPDNGEVKVRDIVAGGKKLKPGPPSAWAPTWNLAQNGRTAYLIQLLDPTLYAIDLLSDGQVVNAVNHGPMIGGKNPDSRCALSIAPDGNVYALVRVDNETGFGGFYLHHLVQFDPTTETMNDLGVLAVKNPDFFFKSPGAKPEHPATNDDHPPYYGYHTLPDGTLTPLYNHLAMIATRDGTIYVTIIYPFTILKIDRPSSKG